MYVYDPNDDIKLFIDFREKHTQQRMICTHNIVGVWYAITLDCCGTSMNKNK